MRGPTPAVDADPVVPTFVPAEGAVVTAELVVPAPISNPPAATATGGDPLLQSKVAIPEPPGFLVARPRLTERVTRGVREPVTLVVGPAGAGKTQLVAAWAAGGV